MSKSVEVGELPKFALAQYLDVLGRVVCLERIRQTIGRFGAAS